MKLGLMLGCFGAEVRMHLEDVKQAEQLGHYALWTATGLRYRCNDPLAYISAHTGKIR
jgi:hypothetical protein